MASLTSSISQTIIHISGCFLPCLKLTNEFAPENEAGVWMMKLPFWGFGPCARANISNYFISPRKGAVTMEAKTFPRLTPPSCRDYYLLPTPISCIMNKSLKITKQHFINFDSSKIWVPFHDC